MFDIKNKEIRIGHTVAVAAPSTTGCTLQVGTVDNIHYDTLCEVKVYATKIEGVEEFYRVFGNSREILVLDNA